MLHHRRTFIAIHDGRPFEGQFHRPRPVGMIAGCPPYNANRILGLIKAMYGKAEQWGLIPANGNPETTIKPFTERKRQRFLSANEFRVLFSKIDELEKLKVIGTYQAVSISPQASSSSFFFSSA